VNAIHVFYDVYMGWNHSSLIEVMQQNAKKGQLEKGELAVFVNKGWTACKILCPGNVLLYFRPGRGFITPEAIRILPTFVGGGRLAFTRNLEAHLIKAHEAKFGKQTKRLKVAYA
jgi:hypothetical protein